MVKNSYSHSIGLAFGIPTGIILGVSITTLAGLITNRNGPENRIDLYERPQTIIFEQDRDGDGIPEYIKQELVDGRYITTKILKGSLDENERVVYAIENEDMNPFP